MILLQKFKISGHSMEPILKNGQEVLISGLPYLFKNPRIGDIVAFKANSTFVIKRVKDIKNNKFLMKGDNKSDSIDFGWIKKSDILGKVIYLLSS